LWRARGRTRNTGESKTVFRKDGKKSASKKTNVVNAKGVSGIDRGGRRVPGGWAGWIDRPPNSAVGGKKIPREKGRMPEGRRLPGESFLHPMAGGFLLRRTWSLLRREVLWGTGAYGRKCFPKRTAMKKKSGEILCQELAASSWEELNRRKKETSQKAVHRGGR